MPPHLRWPVFHSNEASVACQYWFPILPRNLHSRRSPGGRAQSKQDGPTHLFCANFSRLFEPFFLSWLDAGGTLSAKHAGTIDKSSATSIFIDVDDSTTSSQWSTTIRTTLQHARHTITATIVNALTRRVRHRQYSNMRSAFAPGICDSRQDRRRTRVVACQQVSDAFDGTISTAVATWALDSGTVSCVVV